MDDLLSNKLKLTVSYDGTEFSGFQSQANARTVQDVLEVTLSSVLGEEISVCASGRTDAGVHAVGQVISFGTKSQINPDALHRALNSLLPPDIRASHAERVGDEFHARFSAKTKCYQYRIWNATVEDVFMRRFAWWVHQALNEDAMTHAASHLAGVHDFTAFQAAGSPRSSSVRCISEIKCLRDDRLVTITVRADGFLYKMVRNIVGCLVEVGLGRMAPEGVVQLLETRDRTRAPRTAPAKGLFLLDVEY